MTIHTDAWTTHEVRIRPSWRCHPAVMKPPDCPEIVAMLAMTLKDQRELKAGKGMPTNEIGTGPRYLSNQVES